MAELRASMGKLTGDTDKDIKILTDYIFQLTEELRWLTNNLDVTNFNDLGLARYENGRMQFYTKEFDVKSDALRATLTQEFNVTVEGVTGSDGKITAASIIAAINGDTSEVKITADHVVIDGEQLRATVSDQIDFIVGDVTDSSGKITASSIAGAINKSSIKIDKNHIELDSNAIKLTAQTEISSVVSGVTSGGKVTAASIVQAINNSGSTVKISADHVQIEGSTTFLTASDLGAGGSTIIDGGRIKSGTIKGADFVACPSDDYGNETKFRCENTLGEELGGVKYLYENGEEKVYLYTKETYFGAYRIGTPLKMLAEGRASLEADDELYLSSFDSYVQITAGSYYWRFNTNGTMTSGYV